jgi:hypothetical protein
MLTVALVLALQQPSPPPAPTVPPATAPVVVQEKVTLVVVDDRALVDQAPAGFLDKAIQEIDRRKGLKAVRMSELRKKLDAHENQKLGKCGDDAGCLATAAREMGADIVLLVRLIKRDGEDARFLALTRINALRPQVAEDAGTIVGSEKDALPQVPAQIAELFPEAELRAAP